MEIDVRKTAKLCCLEIADDEAELYTEELRQMLTQIEKIPPLEEDLPAEPACMELREDSIQPSMPIEELLGNAPKTAQGYFVVPKTVE